jgi:hypothetical protein
MMAAGRRTRLRCGSGRGACAGQTGAGPPSTSWEGGSKGLPLWVVYAIRHQHTHLR